MTRYIDADALKYEPIPKGDRNYRTYNLDDAYDDGYNDAFTDIRNAPTIDAVPVIRCKACRWFRNDDEGTWCVAWAGQNTNPDAFCSYAQPKERGR